jgi:[acyl-carrier-protein] S-malonyltransferase
MKAYVFPGQGAQFTGMGLDLYRSSSQARALFDEADKLLGFKISQLMFEGDADELKQTRVTQPAIFIHSVIAALVEGSEQKPDMVAGHSLGEFSAMVVAGVLSFEDGLRLVAARAQAMQKACEIQPSTMAAIIGLADDVVESVCAQTAGVVVPANYNCPGQLVISGEVDAVEAACVKLKEQGAKRAMRLPVSGGFHSPCMESARAELEAAILTTPFNTPICPVCQNADALPHSLPEKIKANAIAQLTSPVRWTQGVQRMIADGIDTFKEFGPGTVLQGLIKKINPDVIAQ